jgi:hypothetical protein
MGETKTYLAKREKYIQHFERDTSQEESTTDTGVYGKMDIKGGIRYWLDSTV